MRLRICFGIGSIVLTATFAQANLSVAEAVALGHGVGREADGVAAVRRTLANGGRINERDQAGWTPLMYAALECRPEIVELLLDRGADVNLRAIGERRTAFMDHGQTALAVAASCFIARRRAGVARERGMAPSYARKELEAPRRIARALIRRGADVNAADADGRTPLMMAGMHGWVGVVQELLAAKAAVHIRDHEGRSVSDYSDPSDRETARALLKAGAPPASGESGRTVCDAERALDLPIVDCISGEQLTAAIIRFQRAHALAASGELDPATRKALNIR